MQQDEAFCKATIAEGCASCNRKQSRTDRRQPPVTFGDMRSRLVSLSLFSCWLFRPLCCLPSKRCSPRRTTVAWGYYSAKAKPVLTVHSGDTVKVQTLSTCGSPERLKDGGVAAADIPQYVTDLYAAKDIDKGPGRPHPHGTNRHRGGSRGRRARSAHPARSTSTCPGPAMASAQVAVFCRMTFPTAR